MENMKDKHNYSLKRAVIDGREIWTAYNDDFPWRVGQGETKEEAVNDYLACEDFIENEEEFDFPFEEAERELAERKRSRIIWIIVIILIIAALVGAIAYLMPKIVTDCIDTAVYTSLDKDTIITYAPGETAVPIVEAHTIETTITPDQNEQNNDDPLLPLPSKHPFIIGDGETPEPTEEPEPTPEPEKLYTQYKRDFNKLLKINKDCIGWIEIPGTKVNYPVVFSYDSQKYLTIGFDGKQNKYGTIYATGETGLNVQNLTLYGHASSYGGAMFGALKDYRSKNFYNKHKEIYFTRTNGATYKYTIFAVIEVSVNGKTFNYRQANFLNDADLKEFAAKAQKMNVIDINETVPSGAHLLTLSTCIKGDKRLVVIAYS